MTEEQSRLIRSAEIVEEAMKTDFWPVLKEFCQEASEISLSMSQAQPQNSQWYCGAAKAALDIFKTLNDLPAQKRALLQQLSEAGSDSEAAPEPKSPRPIVRQPLSHI